MNYQVKENYASKSFSCLVTCTHCNWIKERATIIHSGKSQSIVLEIKTLKFSGQLSENKANPETAVCHDCEIPGFGKGLFYMIFVVKVKEDISMK